MINTLPAKPNLDQLKHQAKDLLAAHARKDIAANAILRSLHRFKNSTDSDIWALPIGLQDAQFALAQSYGFKTWNALTDHVEAANKEGTVMPDAPVLKLPGADDVEALKRELADKPASRRVSAELVAVFMQLGKIARREGLAGLEDLNEHHVDDEFIKLGYRELINGCDVGIVREIMEIRKKTLVHAYEQRLEMIVTGVMAVGHGDNPRIIEEKCKAFL